MANPFVHVELSTTDPAKAKAFYTRLFDWKLEDMQMGPGAHDTYTLIEVGEGTGGGLMKHPMPGAPSTWLAYVLVDDIEAATKKVASLGGTVAKDVTEVPGMGWFSIIVDPTGAMPTIIATPSIVQAVGTKPKIIEEYVGRVNTRTDALSIARMKSPEGWSEPGQRPEFDEYTVVLRGSLRVESETATIEVGAGEAVLVRRGEWVRYSTPHPGGAEYVAVCLPAFAPDLVHRDA